MNRQFHPDRLAVLSAIERRHFWFAGRQMIVERFLKDYLPGQPLMLDIGCGTGWTLEKLEEWGYRTIGLDLLPEGLRSLRKRSKTAILLQGDATQLPFMQRAVDGVVFLDVLEHLHDVKAMQGIHGVLKTRGVVIVCVPAFPWLWSYRDVAAGHQRRYTRDSLAKLLRGAGFTILKIRYYQFLLMPVVIITRFLGRKGRLFRDREDLPSPIVNQVLKWINRAEVELGAIVDWPWGTSLLAVCKK